MNTLGAASIAFVVILGGALVGVALRKALPERHLADNTKDVVRLGTGVIGTIAALVLGLLIASAKTSFDAQTGNVTHIAAEVILLDHVLADYGSETNSARGLLRDAFATWNEQIWRENRFDDTTQSSFKFSAPTGATLLKIQQLMPQDELHRSLKDRAIQISYDLVQTRVLMFERDRNSIPIPFLAVLVFWLALIFGSFGIFSDFNSTLAGALLLFALSSAAAIFLILDLSQPFSGLMQVSSDPLRYALSPL